MVRVCHWTNANPFNADTMMGGILAKSGAHFKWIVHLPILVNDEHLYNPYVIDTNFGSMML